MLARIRKAAAGGLARTRTAVAAGLPRVRKAAVAGLGAGAGAAFTVIAKAGWHLDSVTIGQAVAAAAAVGLPVAWATWRTPNAGQRETGQE